MSDRRRDAKRSRGTQDSSGGGQKRARGDDLKSGNTDTSNNREANMQPKRSNARNESEKYDKFGRRIGPNGESEGARKDSEGQGNKNHKKGKGKKGEEEEEEKSPALLALNRYDGRGAEKDKRRLREKERKNRQEEQERKQASLLPHQKRRKAIKSADDLAKEREVARKNHRARFFERQKVERGLKKVLLALEDKPEDKDLLEEKKRLLTDLRYTRFFPHDTEYISLFNEKISEEQKELRTKCRQRACAVARRTERGSEEALLSFYKAKSRKQKEQREKALAQKSKGDNEDDQVAADDDHEVGEEKKEDIAAENDTKGSSDAEDNAAEDETKKTDAKKVSKKQKKPLSQPAKAKKEEPEIDPSNDVEQDDFFL
mmetsp:Transcript_2110/g.4844  ORF Transcript_2110/g.4844 Transcript_2110/m.4844 type:complete len:373 (-) Transcript_2110:178-1296(-)|eukprot:CAMPEP_0171500746 /NCGR_PEP_ID=MMETSP0958-20121227/9157_1 /TAXON_ID=87120 /ORGANISM="Aurantiochytrium limacinum, Strain ATCCMYA-1381" /LENGTH=372 /DNA_ID=CAMNT_0012035451 /DNA_START=143 /DNA_END=1261 /DNA_ORIENTATION=+